MKVLALLVLVFGVATLNFTQDPERHGAWASEKGLPEPSYAMFVMGVAAAVGGAGLLGFFLGRPKHKP